MTCWLRRRKKYIPSCPEHQKTPPPNPVPNAYSTQKFSAGFSVFEVFPHQDERDGVVVLLPQLLPDVLEAPADLLPQEVGVVLHGVAYNVEGASRVFLSFVTKNTIILTRLKTP